MTKKTQIFTLKPNFCEKLSFKQTFDKLFDQKKQNLELQHNFDTFPDQKIQILTLKPIFL